MNMNWRRVALVALLAALTLGLVVRAKVSPISPVLAQDADAGAEADDGEDLEYKDYRLVVSDTIEVVVFGQAEYSRIFMVPPGGKVTFNPIGLLTVVGKTLQDLEAEITRKLLDQDILKDPKVQIHVVAYASREVFLAGAISGMVNLPVHKERRLLQVIAMANGWGRGDKSRVRIIRKLPDGDQYTIPINAETILANEDWAKNIVIKPEDIIYVPEYESASDFRWVYVLGKVGRPGPVPYLRGRQPITLATLITIAGDFTEYADSDDVRIIRKTKGRPRIIKVDFGEILDGERDDVVLEPDDLVFVPESFF